MRPQHRDTIVLGGSAGAIEALKVILRSLPANLEAAVFVVVHLAPTAPSALPAILARNTELSVRHPVDGDPIFDRTMYVAPPDRHLMIEGDRVRLTRGPRENRSRPSVDVLFRSAAECAGSRVVGVLLSGNLDDGAAGLAMIKASGGMTIVQDPADASSPGMPEAALSKIQPDFVLPAAEIGGAITSAVGGELEQPLVIAGGSQREEAALEEHLRLTCPDCSGVIEARERDGVVQFECQVGHRFSEDAMLDAHADGTEAALWIAVRMLEERVRLADRLAERFRGRGQIATAERFRRESHDAALRAEVIRRAIAADGPSLASG